MRVLALKATGQTQLQNLIAAHPELSDYELTTLKKKLTINVNAGREKATVTTIRATAPTAEEAYALTSGTQSFLQEKYHHHVTTRWSDEIASAQERHLEASREFELAQAKYQTSGLAIIGDPQSLRDQVTILDRKISKEQSSSEPSRDAQAKLEAQLKSELSRLSPEHPRVKMLESELSVLSSKQRGLITGTLLDQLQIERAEKRSELTKLQKALDLKILAESKLSETKIELDYAAADLDRMQRNTDFLIKKDKLRLNLVVPATLPEKPRVPSPLHLAVIGVCLAGLLAGGLTLIFAKLDRRVSRPTDLERHFGIIPFATLPEFRPLEMEA